MPSVQVTCHAGCGQSKYWREIAICQPVPFCTLQKYHCHSVLVVPNYTTQFAQENLRRNKLTSSKQNLFQYNSNNTVFVPAVKCLREYLGENLRSKDETLPVDGTGPQSWSHTYFESQICLCSEYSLQMEVAGMNVDTFLRCQEFMTLLHDAFSTFVRRW